MQDNSRAILLAGFQLNATCVRSGTTRVNASLNDDQFDEKFHPTPVKNGLASSKCHNATKFPDTDENCHWHHNS
jgi:hypothetical protein